VTRAEQMSALQAGVDSARAGLMREWSMADDPDAAICPFRAGAKLQTGPDVFFKGGEAHVRATGLGGNWVVTRYALQEEVLLDPQRFSSHLSIGFSKLIGDNWPLVPLELAPPEHALYRKLIAPWFSAAKARAMHGEIRALANQLLDDLGHKQDCEFMDSFGRPYPVTVFMRMMDLPKAEMPTFLRWAEDLLRGATMELRANAAQAMKDYLLKVIAARRAEPGDDMVSYFIATKVDGAEISPDRLLGLCFMLFIGGLDTVASSLGFVFRELAVRPELQQQLRANPGLIPAATDEFIRAFGVVTTFRYATQDMNFHGAPISKGDLVELPLGLSSRDDRMYDDAHVIDFHRKKKRALTFSTGPHTCAGLHLARTEIRIALEVWMQRMPELRLSPLPVIKTATESVWALENLPLVWTYEGNG
jgi:cytochrome P450